MQQAFAIPGMPPPAAPADSDSSSAAFSCFVGDLAPEVNDFLLQESFRQFYPSVRSAKVRRGERVSRLSNSGLMQSAVDAPAGSAVLLVQ